MSSRRGQSSSDAGQRELDAALAALGERLRLAAGSSVQPASKEAPSSAAPRTPDEATEGLLLPSSLRRMGEAFGLTPFEQELLLLCAGVELSPEIAACCAALQGAPQATRVTVGLAMTALSNAHWSAISPLGPLRRWKLIESRPAQP